MPDSWNSEFKGWPPRLAGLTSVLVCPTCRGALRYHADRAACRACAKTYPVRGNKLYFVESATKSDALDRLKGLLKRLFGSRYPWLTGVLGPTLLPNYLRLVDNYFPGREKLILDIGCGNRRVRDDVIGIDVIDYAAVDIICDMHRLPFRDASVDGVVTWNVIEHVPEAHRAVLEIFRCLAEGALAAHEIPFLMPFHASPKDFVRYTHQGAESLFAPYEVVEQKNLSGPFSLFCLVASELLSVVLSFGRPNPRAALFLINAALLSPLKYLDLPLVGKKSLIGLAPTILTVVRKTTPATAAGQE